MKKLRTLAAAVLAGIVSSASATSFYVVAHPDDIELFMFRQAALDVRAGAKVVFVVVNAGDGVAGEGGKIVSSGWVPFPHDFPPPNAEPYPYTREIGHHAALLHIYSLRGQSGMIQDETFPTIAGKTIRRTLIGSPDSNMVMYNLRLPDGYASNISTTNLKAIGPEPAPTYSLDGLYRVLNGIIDAEKQSNINSWVNIQDSTATYLCSEGDELRCDHSDHVGTAKFVKQALTKYKPSHCVRTLEWKGYPIQYGDVTFNATEQQWQFDAWTVLNEVMVEHGGPDTREPGHNVFLGKATTTSLPPGAYSCGS